MTSKIYLLTITKIVVLAISVIILSNLYDNDFGLFGKRNDIRVWALEKTSKYLFSFKYVPDNFEGVLIGPSVSANMDTRNIDGLKIYNLSMNSANVSELKYAADNVIKSGKIKYLVICLYPYITKDSGKKGRQIDEKEYFGSLFSIIPIQLMIGKVKSVIKPQTDLFHASEWGFNDSNLNKKHIVFKEIVDERRRNPETHINIDPVAYEELGDIINLAHTNNVQVLAYYYPIYSEFLASYKSSGAWKIYKGKMNKLFEMNDIVWDMNTSEYDYITNKLESYSDGHLSDKGAVNVIDVISRKLSGLLED